jgi:hypothetical protein
MRGPPPVGENLVPFPALVRLAPLANKRALLAQTRQAAVWLEYAIDLEPPEDNFKAALRKVADDHAYHPVVEYLDSLRPWDGVPRIDKLFITYCGSEDTPLCRAQARKSMCGAVRRAKKPGCQWDYVPILEWDQGILKSTFIRTLAVKPEWYGETKLLGQNTKVVQELVGGKWFYELGEMGGLTESKAEDVKQMITQKVDRGRKAYGEFAEDQTRKCVFWGTKNPNKKGGYLVDPTGNRRFWPRPTPGVIDDGSGKKKIDIAGLQRDLEQLWAEACVAEPNEELFLAPELERLAEVEAAKRMVSDEWEPLLAEKLQEFMEAIPVGYRMPKWYEVCDAGAGKVEWRVTSYWLLATKPIGIQNSEYHAKHGGRLRAVMEKLGWKHLDKVFRIGSWTGNGYTRIGDAVCTKPAVDMRQELAVTPITSASKSTVPSPAAGGAAPRLVVNNEGQFRRRVFKADARSPGHPWPCSHATAHA